MCGSGGISVCICAWRLWFAMDKCATMDYRGCASSQEKRRQEKKKSKMCPQKDLISYQYIIYENKMVDHRKSCLRQKLLRIPVVLVSNGYTATIKTSNSTVDVQCRIVNQSKSPVSPVCTLTD